MGQLYGSKQYNDELTDIAAGFFLGSLAIDSASSIKEISDRKYKKWTRKIDLDERIINNSFFLKGLFKKERNKQYHQ
jgi:hypothetical protein